MKETKKEVEAVQTQVLAEFEEQGGMLDGLYDQLDKNAASQKSVMESFQKHINMNIEAILKRLNSPGESIPKLNFPLELEEQQSLGRPKSRQQE